MSDGAWKRDSRRRTRRTDARVYVRRRAACDCESLADRRSSVSRIYETFLRSDAGKETSTRRRPPRRAGLDVSRSTLAPATLLGRVHNSRRMEVTCEAGDSIKPGRK